MDSELQHCVTAVRLDSLAGGSRPWAPGTREEDVDIERAAANPDGRLWCMSEVDIFCDLDDREMDAMAAAAPMRNYGVGDLVYTPHQPLETLFILKKGRIRIFRVSPDGRALTTAIIEPGTIFGEMVIVGQQMHDSFAEALDEVVVCVMSKADVRRLLLGDSRIAARISETLGRRLGEIEQRLSDAIFKSVPERIAGTLVTLAGAHSSPGPRNPGQAHPRTARRASRNLPRDHYQDPQRVRGPGPGHPRPRPHQHPGPRPHAARGGSVATPADLPGRRLAMTRCRLGATQPAPAARSRPPRRAPSSTTPGRPSGSTPTHGTPCRPGQTGRRRRWRRAR